MPTYEVKADCYVPVGAGARYKKAGQLVVLDEDAAVELGGYVARVPDLDGGVQSLKPEGVAERNTPESEPEPEEVTSDGGESPPADG